MSVDRREFIANAGKIAAAATLMPSRLLAAQEHAPQASSNSPAQKAYGSGYFGNWIEDEFGLPAFHYTCDQVHDPRAKTDVNPGILSPTEHIHQVGNDRIIGIASNYGLVRVRQDEGAPKFLNDHAPERGIFAGGFGCLSDGKSVLSTIYSGEVEAITFDRIFGIGYFRKRLKNEQYGIDQMIFAPFGDDPVLISQVTLTNNGSAEAQLRWVEYWSCQPYQFSFRSFMESFTGKSMHELRGDFGGRFEHSFKKTSDGSGLIETKSFTGRDATEEKQFAGMVAYLEKNPNPFLAVPDKNAPKLASFDDLNPPATFLVSLDAPADGFSSDGLNFFLADLDYPSGAAHELEGDLDKTGPRSALLLERKFALKPGESRTLTFLYGYLPSGFDLDSLATKYRKTAQSALADSSNQWKKNGLHFSTESEPWVEREVTWNHYYLRSGLSYDD